MSEKVKFQGTLVLADQPNRNGRIYPRDVVEQIYEQLEEGIQKNRVFISHFDRSRETANINDLIGIVTDASMPEDPLRIDLQGELFNTYASQCVLHLMDSAKKEHPAKTDEEAFQDVFDLRPRGRGQLTEDNVVKSGYELLGVDVFLKEDR